MSCAGATLRERERERGREREREVEVIRATPDHRGPKHHINMMILHSDPKTRWVPEHVVCRILTFRYHIPYTTYHVLYYYNCIYCLGGLLGP